MCELSYMIIFCLFKSFVLWLRRRGLLTFFSSLVIQESLINCANERLRSRIFLHCENILCFCLSASHSVVEFGFAEIASTSKTIRTSSLTMLALVWSSGRFLTAKTHILFLVELAIAEMACVSRNIRRTFHVPSGVPVQRSISERDCSHPLVEFVFAEIASTSQTIRTSFLTMLALVWSSGRFLPAKTHILL